MEPVSAVASLLPGEEFSYSEDCYLLGYPPSLNTEFDIKIACEFLQSIIKNSKEK